MAIPKQSIQAGKGAIVQQVKLVFAGYEFNLPTDPAAVHQGIPFPQLLVALALEVANMKMLFDDVLVATKQLDVDVLKSQLIALQGFDPEAALRVELVLDALDQIEAVRDIILEARLRATRAAHEEAKADGDDGEEGDSDAG